PKTGESVDEVERVLDLVSDPGGQLPERRHFLSVQQAGLRRLQFLQCALGGVARRADFLLSTPAFGDVAVNYHEAAARHGVAAHLDDPAVGPRVLEAQFLVDRFEAPAEFRRDAVRAEFAALS